MYKNRMVSFNSSWSILTFCSGLIPTRVIYILIIGKGLVVGDNRSRETELISKRGGD